MTRRDGNGWHLLALKVAGALLLLALGWIGNGVINDHQKIQDHEKRIAVLEAEHKR